MAIVGFIVVGDRTSHGGIVISGNMTYTIYGVPVARVGDKVFCPRCKQTTVIISSRFPTVSSMGQVMTYDQDSTSCGALLYSRHNGHAGWDCGGPESTPVRADASASVDQNLPKGALSFQEHFILHDETGKLMANVPYFVRTGEGRTYEGETDAEGQTDVVWTDSPDVIEVKVGPRIADSPDPYHYDEQAYGDL
jgi:uncharacterized Zn-binding protein involved in type VI secretion